MRFIFLLTLACSLLAPGWPALSAQSPGLEAQRVTRASALEPGFGAAVISIRSELYLEEELDVFFLGEGGEVTDDAYVIRIKRKQDFFAFGNSTVRYQLRAYQLPAGTYRLVAHAMDYPKNPAENERCLIDRRGLTGTVEVSRPSRGYGEDAPSFEVRSGSITYAGDFALTARNTIEWPEVPTKELGRISRRFRSLERGPEPVVSDEFKLKYGLFPRSFQDDGGRRF